MIRFFVKLKYQTRTIIIIIWY